MLDLQKASMLKRISAFILDVILLAVAITGFAFFLSATTGFDFYDAKLKAISTSCDKEYGVEKSFEEFNTMKPDEKAERIEKYKAAFEALTDEEKTAYKETYKAENEAEYEAARKAAFDAYNEIISTDADANHAYVMVINLTLVITSISILFGYLLLEFAVPLMFKNGQTIGKKIFGIALMRNDGVKINTVMLFVRTVLGKYTIETMIPVLIIIMTFFGSAGIVGLAVLLLIGVLELVMLCITKTRSCIHDLLAYTVAVDMQSQMIFESPEALLEYKKKLHADVVADSDYK